MLSEKRLAKFVKPLYAKKDEMHNFSHILRIKRKVAFLRKGYKNLDGDLLLLLIYFHGIKKWVRKNKKKVLEMGFSKKQIERLIKKNHSPKNSEEKIVFDANMLENVGRFGIKKMLILEKAYGQTRKDTIALAKKFLSEYKFYTPIGKRLGKKGIKIRKKWLKKEIKRYNKKEG